MIRPEGHPIDGSSTALFSTNVLVAELDEAFVLVNRVDHIHMIYIKH